MTVIAGDFKMKIIAIILILLPTSTYQPKIFDFNKDIDGNIWNKITLTSFGIK